MRAGLGTVTVCKIMKQKLHQLAKLSLFDDCSSGNEKVGKNVLNLGKGSFSAGCRNISGAVMSQLLNKKTKFYFM